MNIERIYMWLNVVCFLFGAFFMYDYIQGEVGWWVPVTVIVAPTVLLLSVIGAALAWSFYLTREEPEDWHLK